MLASILYSAQSLTILIASSSLYSKSKLRLAIVILLVLPYQITAKPWMKSLACERMESATRCGMESMHSVALDGIKTEGEGDTRQAVMPYAQRTAEMKKAPSNGCLKVGEFRRKANICALFAWQASLPIFEWQMRTPSHGNFAREGALDLDAGREAD